MTYFVVRHQVLYFLVFDYCNDKQGLPAINMPDPNKYGFTQLYAKTTQSQLSGATLEKLLTDARKNKAKIIVKQRQ